MLWLLLLQVRIRKENQIYSAEEKAALAMFNFEASGMQTAVVTGCSFNAWS